MGNREFLRNYDLEVVSLNRTYDGSYFQQRGVNKSIFDLFQLGTAPASAGISNELSGKPAFPIQDINGKVISIAYRVGSSELKYYSHPYRRSTTLYGLYQAIPHILSSGEVNIVEGYFDVLAAFSHGLPNTVGIMGAAISKEQIIILSSFAKKFVLIPDTDKTGVRALTKNRKLIFSIFSDITIDERYVFPSKDFAEYLLKKEQDGRQ